MDFIIVLFLLTNYGSHVYAGFAFTVSGNITVDNPLPPYSSGDVVKFNFTISLNGEENVTALTFKFVSDTLMFLPEASKSMNDQLQWFYEKADMDGSFTIHNRSTSTPFTESYDGTDNSIEVAFPARGGASELFFGQLAMIVRDNIGTAKQLGCKAEIGYYFEEPVRREIESEVTYSTLPGLGLIADYPVNLKVLESTHVTFTLDLPVGLTEATLQVAMPVSETDLAPQLSVDNLLVEHSQALNAADVTILTPTYECQTLEGINDVAIVNPILVTMNTSDSPGNELEFGFDAKTEIFRGIENASELFIGAGLKFGDSFLWVAEVPVFLLDDYNREALITHNVTYVSEHGHDGEISVTLKVWFGHEDSSTDHAYDITVVIYLMPIMLKAELIGSQTLGEHGSVLVGNKFILTVDRVRLNTNPYAIINVTLDATDAIFWVIDPLIVISEMYYYGGYTNSSEISQEMKHLIIPVDKISAEQLTFTTENTCTCDFDPGRTDCGCCRSGGCQCGETNPGFCVDCNKPWRCETQIAGFDQQSSLNDEYICRAYRLYRPLASRTSCYWEQTVDKWTELPQDVAVILGKDTSKDTLYGISNTGQGYVISLDGGLSWGTVDKSVWDTAASSTNYVSATLTDY